VAHVNVDGTSISRIRLAANLANRFACDLIGIAARILPPDPAEGAYFVPGEMVERERQDIEASLARAEGPFAQRPARGGRDSNGDPA
jgi:hypothetical protein